MFFLLLYLMLVTLAMSFMPEWSVATSMLVPLAVVVVGRLALALTPTNQKEKAPGKSDAGGQG